MIVDEDLRAGCHWLLLRLAGHAQDDLIARLLRLSARPADPGHRPRRRRAPPAGPVHRSHRPGHFDATHRRLASAMVDYSDRAGGGVPHHRWIAGDHCQQRPVPARVGPRVIRRMRHCGQPVGYPVRDAVRRRGGPRAAQVVFREGRRVPGSSRRTALSGWVRLRRQCSWRRWVAGSFRRAKRQMITASTVKVRPPDDEGTVTAPLSCRASTCLTSEPSHLAAQRSVFRCPRRRE